MSMRRQHELLLNSTILYCIYWNALKAFLCSYVILILICIQILKAQNDDTVIYDMYDFIQGRWYPCSACMMHLCAW